ncbi:nucleoside hydrolase [Paenibacillus sp. GCM10023252]|uniref:nucleoside hydrolase n=1 Tax=Paenibacillus sp. GCM10023252 TaxID=3252649 RepID=UPI00361991CB
MLSKIPMIIDADTGIDDALAILYALKSPEIDLIGITTVFGNTSVEQATDNTLRLLKLAGADVPVAMGAAKPLARPWPGTVAEVHGENGIGDAQLAPSDQQPLGESAAEFLVRKANELAGELVIVPVGRMTNLAEALRLDPELPRKVKQVVIMGGNVYAPGNITPTSEANFFGDPESADLVMQSGLPIIMVGLDVTMKTIFNQGHLDVLNRSAQPENRELVQFLNEALPFYFTFYQKVNNFVAGCAMHDPLAVMVAVNPTLVRTQTMRVQIECESTRVPGMVIADLRAKPSAGTAVQVCVEVNAEAALNQLLAVF